MDINKIKEVILSQINGTSGLYSLQVQNHIYGCFIIMEDIAQKVVSLNEMTLIYSGTADDKKEFHLEEKFSEIGLHYGFIMDNKLELESFNAEYKAMWLDCFKVADLTHDVSLVDEVEDVIIELLTSQLAEKDAYFLNALETGCLSDEWVARVLQLLHPQEPIAQIVDAVCDRGEKVEMKESESVDNLSEALSETSLKQVQVAAAAKEKIIRSHHGGRGKALHKTRRNIQIISIKRNSTTPKSKKKTLILTRRNIKSEQRK